MVKFTVIVPVYNVESHLKKCIDSLLKQTYKDFEILLIDDGSTDESGQICDDYAKKDNRVRVIHQDNGGLSVARNTGVKNARGEWVSFVDGDDWIEPDTMEFANNFLSEAPYDSDILTWDGYADWGNGKVNPICFMDNKDDSSYYFHHDAKDHLIKLFFPRYYRPAKINRYTSFCITWARIYRREFLIKNNIWNKPGLKRAQDMLFNLWAFEKARIVGYKRKHLYHYCMHPDATTKKYTDDITDSMYALYENIKDFVEKNRPNDIEWLQRYYAKGIIFIQECFNSKFAKSGNGIPIKDRAELIEKDLDRPLFKKAIENFDSKGQRIKLKVFHYLIKRKLYKTTIYLFSGHLLLKSMWFKRKRNKTEAAQA